MALDPITFECGHKLIDNGAGDYCMRCPDGHIQRPTIFPHLALDMVHNHSRWACERCDVTLGRRTSGTMPFERLGLPAEGDC